MSGSPAAHDGLSLTTTAVYYQDLGIIRHPNHFALGLSFSLKFKDTKTQFNITKLFFEVEFPVLGGDLTPTLIQSMFPYNIKPKGNPNRRDESIAYPSEFDFGAHRRTWISESKLSMGKSGVGVDTRKATWVLTDVALTNDSRFSFVVKVPQQLVTEFRTIKIEAKAMVKAGDAIQFWKKKEEIARKEIFEHELKTAWAWDEALFPPGNNDSWLTTKAAAAHW